MFRPVVSVIVLACILFHSIPCEARTRAATRPKNRPAAVKVKPTKPKIAKVPDTKKLRRVQRHKMVMQELKVEAPPKRTAVTFADEVLLAEAKGSLVPLEGAAYSLIGTRYRFGGDTERGIDCSAFVKKVFSLLSRPLPRTAREQFEVGREVPLKEAKKGDLLFFHTYAKYASHVGIYLGDGRMIHASSGGGQVMISSIDKPYYRSRLMGVRRVDDMSAIDPDLQREAEPRLAVTNTLLAEISNVQ